MTDNERLREAIAGARKWRGVSDWQLQLLADAAERSLPKTKKAWLIKAYRDYKPDFAEITFSEITQVKDYVRDLLKDGANTVTITETETSP